MDLRIGCGITLQTALCVGSTAGPLRIGIDRVTAKCIVKDSPPTTPIIPASTMKGKLRWECERILRALGHDVCRSPRSDLMCPHYLLSSPGTTHCPVCVLFGCPGLESPLRFHDAELNRED